MANRRKNEMREAAERLLETCEVDYEFGMTKKGHQWVTLRHGTLSRKVIFAGGHGKDQSAMNRMLSFLRKSVAEIGGPVYNAK